MKDKKVKYLVWFISSIFFLGVIGGLEPRLSADSFGVIPVVLQAQVAGENGPLTEGAHPPQIDHLIPKTEIALFALG